MCLVTELLAVLSLSPNRHIALWLQGLASLLSMGSLVPDSSSLIAKFMARNLKTRKI